MELLDTALNPTGQYFGYGLARKRDRFFASIIESLILGIIFGIPLYFILGKEAFLDPFNFSSFVTQAAISTILGSIFYPMWSGGIGHKIMNLKVISAEDGKDINIAKMGAIRESIKFVMGYLLIPVMWLLWDKDRQNLYDKITKTYVVKTR
jgi:uncharacterized RDD family membrane protein YckC